MCRMNSKDQCAKCKGFSHIFANCSSKPLVIQEHKDIRKKKLNRS